MTAAPIRRIGIVAKSRLSTAGPLLAELARWLEARQVEAIFESETATLASPPVGGTVYSRDELPKRVDLVLVLGGDGTLLSMADRIAQAERDIPILGVNFGSLGFLTEITLPELYPSLESVLAGRAQLDDRLMLQSRTIRGGHDHDRRLVLNDVVFSKSTLARMIDLSVSVNGRFVTRVRADGLIVASPTGSTAYNLAAGGPIVHPAVDALVITPIAPHQLTNRPVVIPSTSEVEVRPHVPTGRDDVIITLDGQYGYALQHDDVVIIGRADRPLRLVRASARSYFEVLSEKLNWGAK